MQFRGSKSTIFTQFSVFSSCYFRISEFNTELFKLRQVDTFFDEEALKLTELILTL